MGAFDPRLSAEFARKTSPATKSSRDAGRTVRVRTVIANLRVEWLEARDPLPPRIGPRASRWATMSQPWEGGGTSPDVPRMAYPPGARAKRPSTQWGAPSSSTVGTVSFRADATFVTTSLDLLGEEEMRRRRAMFRQVLGPGGRAQESPTSSSRSRSFPLSPASKRSGSPPNDCTARSTRRACKGRSGHGGSTRRGCPANGDDVRRPPAPGPRAERPHGRAGG
jgi:hypothetical protein